MNKQTNDNRYQQQYGGYQREKGWERVKGNEGKIQIWAEVRSA